MGLKDRLFSGILSFCLVRDLILFVSQMLCLRYYWQYVYNLNILVFII